jgi:hypothetical protein
MASIENMAPVDWLLRVADGKNLIRSSKHKIWGIDSKSTSGKNFLKKIKPGDRLWFVKRAAKGKIIAVATYKSHNNRGVGPLVNTTLTNEELGWDKEDTDWTSDTEIHYMDLYNLSDCELLSGIKSPLSIREYSQKCMVNLPVEYPYICKYRKVTLSM